MQRVLMLLVTCAVAPSPVACDCAPQAEADAVVDDNDVRVGPDGLTVTREGRPVLAVRPGDVGVKKGSAFYDMQFGMFDIQEDGDDFSFADSFVLTGIGGSLLTFDVVKGEEVVAQGVVLEDGGGLRVQLQAVAGDRVIVKTPCAATDHFLGLGAQTHDVDHRGQIVPLWVSEQGVGKSDSDELPAVWQVLGRRHTTHVPMPAFVRSDGVAVIVDTDAFARFDLCASEEEVASFEVWSSLITLDVFARSSVLSAQQAMTKALGRPRLLPPYALAPWNDAIFSDDDVLAFASFLRDNEIPSSVLWSEDWRGGEFQGDLYRLDEDWRLDEEQYPDYDAMAASLRANGFVHQVYFNTFVTQSGDVAEEVAASSFDIRTASTGESLLFAGPDRDFSPTALVDLTNEDARTYMKEEHLVPTLQRGAGGWMADFAEWMPVEDVALASEEDPALVHNRYPELWQRLNDEARAEAGAAGEDAVFFYRSGHLGSPPFVDVLWAGDQRTSFSPDDGLPTVIPIGIGTATTGFSFFTHDIGGYQSATNDPTTKELWFRWVELGAFTPIMRTHHGTHVALNHNLTTDAESTAHWKRYAELHVRLYPYLRALMHAAVDEEAVAGAGLGPLPLWVPLPLLFPDDEAVWSIKDEVMLGPSLLIAPIIEEGATSRTVHLPAGSWGSFFSPDENFSGDVEVDAPLGEIPVFVRAGGIVPMTAEPAQTLLNLDGAIPDLLSTRGDRVVVVGRGGEGEFVEEDGSSYVLKASGSGSSTERTGDGVIEGDGFTLTLSGHPSDRRVVVEVR